jgi:hypothetical protein
LVKNQQERLQSLSDNLHAQGNLHQQVYALLNTTDKVRLSKKVDVIGPGGYGVGRVAAPW